VLQLAHQTSHELALDRIASTSLLPSVPRHVEHLLGSAGTFDGSERLGEDGLSVLETLDQVPRLVTRVVRVDTGDLGRIGVGKGLGQSLDSVELCIHNQLLFRTTSLDCQ
jgi:hypothetical protein